MSVNETSWFLIKIYRFAEVRNYWQYIIIGSDISCHHLDSLANLKHTRNILICSIRNLDAQTLRPSEHNISELMYVYPDVRYLCDENNKGISTTTLIC